MRALILAASVAIVMVVPFNAVAQPCSGSYCSPTYPPPPNSVTSACDSIRNQLNMTLAGVEQASNSDCFGGQSFMPAIVDRVRRLRAKLDARGLTQVDIEIDGGINPETDRQVVATGATVLGAGNAVLQYERLPSRHRVATGVSMVEPSLSRPWEP